MRVIVYWIFFLALTSISAASSFEERLSKATSLIFDKPDSAYMLASALQQEANSKNNHYLLVRSNYILGYIQDVVKKDYAQAIIHYLEAIRYGEKTHYEGVEKTLAGLHKNCGIIFRKFNAFDLAEEYYLKGIDYAITAKDLKEEISIKYNLSGVYREKEEYEKALGILENIHAKVKKDSKKFFDILNRLSNTYLKVGNYDQVIYYSNLIIENPNLNYPRILAFSNHLIGKVHLIQKDFSLANFYFNNTYNVIEENPDNFNRGGTAKFEVFVDLGLSYFRNKDLQAAISYFKSAESILPSIAQRPENLELYKIQANLYYELGYYKKSKSYEDKYAEGLNQYLKVQQEIQETDQRYNMDLITKRYFAEVDKQERVANILMYSKLTSGGLIVLLILVIVYFKYQKFRLRRNIENDLIALNIIKPKTITRS